MEKQVPLVRCLARQQGIIERELVDEMISRLAEQHGFEVKYELSGVTIRLEPDEFPYNVKLSYSRAKLRFKHETLNKNGYSGLCLLREEIIEITDGAVSLYWTNSTGGESGDGIKTIFLMASDTLRNIKKYKSEEDLKRLLFGERMRIALKYILEKMSCDKRVNFAENILFSVETSSA